MIVLWRHKYDDGIDDDDDDDDEVRDSGLTESRYWDMGCV